MPPLLIGKCAFEMIDGGFVVKAPLINPQSSDVSGKKVQSDSVNALTEDSLLYISCMYS